MTKTVVEMTDVQAAVTEGRLDELRLQRIELIAGPGCQLNCGINAPVLSLQGSFLDSWVNHDGTQLVLDLRHVNFNTPHGMQHRQEAIAFIETDPPAPKMADE